MIRTSPFSRVFFSLGVAVSLTACGALTPQAQLHPLPTDSHHNDALGTSRVQQIVRNFPSFVDAMRFRSEHPTRLPSTWKANLGLGQQSGRFNTASGGLGDVLFDFVLAQELGLEPTVADPSKDIMDVRMSLADTATRETLTGRIVLWVPTRVTEAGWQPAVVPGTFGTPFAGSALPLADVTAHKTLARAAWVSVAAKVRAARAASAASAGLPPQAAITLAFEDPRFPDGNKERLKPLLTLKPRAQAFQVSTFDPRFVGSSAFFWSPVGSNLLRQTFVPLTVGKAFYGYRTPFAFSGDVALPRTGASLRFALDGVGVLGVGQDASSRTPLLGHYAPKRFTLTNTQSTAMPFKIHSVKATAEGVSAERTIFQGTLAPGREQTVPVASLESLSPRDFRTEKPYYHFIVLESGGEQTVVSVLAQGFLGDPIGRGFTFPY
ncbi:MAG: hypothetical protein IOD12_08745 [Silvanigrellales bacterium]|nr:hypothetical protein [Silvanigrellales bacterium]